MKEVWQKLSKAHIYLNVPHIIFSYLRTKIKILGMFLEVS